MKIHLLSAGMMSPNGRATLFPIIRYHSALKKAGYPIRWFRSPSPACLAGQVLCVELKYLTHLRRFSQAEAIAFLDKLSQKVPSLWLFDNSDSTALALPQILPKVDLYIKNQLLLDRRKYLRHFEGSTLFTDFYANTHPGEFSSELEGSWKRGSVDDPQWLGKLAVAWNSGLSDYSPDGPSRLRRAKKATRFLPRALHAAFFQPPRALGRPSVDRPLSLHCRMNFSYQPDIFSAQRKKVARTLGLAEQATQKLPRKEYFQELLNTWAVLSPFGYGEITLKDFEAFLCGNVLVKPDMSHMETWPPLYEAWKTYVPVKWDLSDLSERLEDIEENREHYLPIAIEGQSRYIEFLSGPHAGELFAHQVKKVAESAENTRN